MKTYTVHHSVNREDTFPNKRLLRRWLKSPNNEHKLVGSRIDVRTIRKGVSSEPEKLSLHELI